MVHTKRSPARRRLFQVSVMYRTSILTLLRSIKLIKLFKMKILRNYILRGFLQHAGFTFLVFSVVLLLERIFVFVRMAMDKGTGMLLVLQMLGLSMPALISMCIPMTFLSGTLLTLGRFSQDRELFAVYAAGIRPWKFSFPLLILSFVTAVLFVPFNNEVVPRANHLVRKSYIDAITSGPQTNIQEKMFNELGDYRIYVRNVNPDTKELKGVIIYQIQPGMLPTLITANRGKWNKTDGVVTIDLMDGILQRQNPDEPHRYNSLNFTGYTISIVTSEQINATNYRKNTKEMTGNDLKQEILRLQAQNIPANVFIVERELRVALAWAVFLLTILAIPLGGKHWTQGKARGFGMSLVIILIYYFLITAGVILGERARLNPIFSVWLPNLLVAITGVLLWQKLER